MYYLGMCEYALGISTGRNGPFYEKLRVRERVFEKT